MGPVLGQSSFRISLVLLLLRLVLVSDCGVRLLSLNIVRGYQYHCGKTGSLLLSNLSHVVHYGRNPSEKL